MNVEIHQLAENDPRRNLDYEEQLFHRLKASPRPALLFYINDPCVVLGRSNRAGDWVDLDAIEEDGIPLLRRFSGGGAVYQDRENLNFSFILPKELLLGAERPSEAVPGPKLYIDYFRRLVIRALEHGGKGYAPGGISDITLNGRKVSGNAERISAGLVLHHGTLMLRCPLAAIERYLKLPPNRPGIPHAGFVTGLAEEGRGHTMHELSQWIAEEFRAAVAGIR